MNRARESEDWGRFKRKVFHDSDCEDPITRYGKPDIIHKKGTPYTRETVWFCFYRKKNGSFSKHQKKGMEILSALGLRILRWPEKN